MASNSAFSAFVSLACHDLRTPLATVHGFARTIGRMEPVTEGTAAHLKMIEEASVQIGALLDQVALVARIESGRYEPRLADVGSLELATAAAAHLEDGSVAVEGLGAAVKVDVESTERALAAFASCALRHGGLDQVQFDVKGTEIVLSPTTPESAPVLTGDELRDLGAATARRLVEQLGGSVALDGETFVVRLPQ